MLILETEVVAVAATYVAMNLSDNFTNVTCYGGNNGSASVTISNGIAPYSYTWNIPNQSTNTVTNLTAGSYNVTVTDATGATIGKSFTVTQPTQLLSTTNITNATCNLINGSITLNTTGGTAPYTYQWQSSSNTSNSLNNISAGAYQVTVTDANNCKINNTYPLTTTIPPNLTVSSNPTICAGQSTTLTASGASTYQWSNGQNTPAIAVSPSQTTTYIVTATSNGCSVSKNIDVVVNTVNANISGKTNVCAGESTILTASGAASYQWNNGQNTPAITVSPSQTTTYVVTATSNGCSVSKTIDVVVNTVSTSISGKTIICAGESTILTASGASSYQWSNGQNTSTITVSPNQTTTYIVTATSNGCSLSKPIEVKVTALPKVPTITVNINQFLCNDSGNLQWYLNNTLILGANKTAYNATQSGTYYVTNTINGCSSSSAPIIFVLVSNNDFITKEDIKIYPNPAQNELTIDFQNIENNVYQLEIYSIEGRIFYSQYLYQPKTKIDITDISDGLYNIILKKENNIMYNYRFIKL